MHKKIIHLLENIIEKAPIAFTEEALIALLVAGCAVTQINSKQAFQKYINKDKIGYTEFRQGEIPGISLGDTFLLEKYVAPEIPKQEFLTDEQIKKYLENNFNKIKLPDYISRDYVEALIKQESDNNPEAVSSWGARGLMQLVENTWHDYETSSYDEAFNPQKNIYVGLKHLKQMDDYCSKNYPNYLELSNGEKQDILSAVYNVGVGKFERKGWDISKMPRETRKHVKKIREKLDSTG